MPPSVSTRPSSLRSDEVPRGGKRETCRSVVFQPRPETGPPASVSAAFTASAVRAPPATQCDTGRRPAAMSRAVAKHESLPHIPQLPPGSALSTSDVVCWSRATRRAPCIDRKLATTPTTIIARPTATNTPPSTTGTLSLSLRPGVRTPGRPRHIIVHDGSDSHACAPRTNIVARRPDRFLLDSCPPGWVAISGPARRREHSRLPGSAPF